MLLSRRGLLPILLPGLAGGCGFRPLYGPGAGGVSAAGAGLGEIQVGLIPERRGQLLREALKARFEREGGGVARRYDLAVSFEITSDGIGIQRDNATSRVRLVGIASWALTAQDVKRTRLANGVARQVVDNRFMT